VTIILHPAPSFVQKGKRAVAIQQNSIKHVPWRRAVRDGSTAVMKRILLAEDDNDMRQFLTRALKNAGYEVVSFDNGKSAYERLREEPFSLLLSDIVMPEMDGIELAPRATELDPDLKVMFITGFAAVALNPDSEAPKDASVLSKPFHLKDLVNEVERLLAA
jgi:two-component system cell cycle response regulator CpdR